MLAEVKAMLLKEVNARRIYADALEVVNGIETLAQMKSELAAAVADLSSEKNERLAVIEEKEARFAASQKSRMAEEEQVRNEQLKIMVSAQDQHADQIAIYKMDIFGLVKIADEKLAHLNALKSDIDAKQKELASVEAAIAAARAQAKQIAGG